MATTTSTNYTKSDKMYDCYKCNQTWYSERISKCPCCDGVYSDI